MKRWIPIAIVAVVLLACNVVGRIISPEATDSVSANYQSLVGVLATAAMALTALLAGAWWTVRIPLQRAVSELGLAIVVGVFASVLLGPLLVGADPFAGGVGLVLAELLFFFGVTAVAAFVGFMIVTVFGADYRGRNLRRVERHYSRGRRPVNRRTD